MPEKKQLADTMREMTASADYRKVKAEMMRLQRAFSKVTHVMLFKPNKRTLEMLRNEGFTVDRTKVVEYEQFKCSW